MLLIPAAVLVPYGIRWVLAISKSDNGIASPLLPYVVPPALIAGSASRLLEFLDASSAYEYPEYLDLRRAGTLLAWTSILATLGGTALWALAPGALHKSSERAPAGAGHKTEVRILSFANAYCMALSLLFSGRLSWHLSGSRSSQTRR